MGAIWATIKPLLNCFGCLAYGDQLKYIDL